ncbi:TPA: hypothetical protein DCX16_04975, partial [bacterium]|nr:hypothetical protein [bacterium]
QKGAKGTRSEEGIKQTKGRTVMNETSKDLEEYMLKVIIEAKWEKVKEELVPREWEPLRPWISYIPTIKGEFRGKEVSFGYYNSHTDPPIMPRSITLDCQKNLYILDPCNFRVLKFNKDGKYLGLIEIKRIKPKEGHLGPFEIFLPRMTMCCKAAEYLGCKFGLVINGTRFSNLNLHL